MRNKLLSLVLFTLILGFVLVLSACGQNDSDSTSIQTPTYLGNNDLYFSKGYDFSSVSDYFQKNGEYIDTYYQISTSNDYGKVASSRIIRFYPSTKQFVVSSTQQENSSELGIVYQRTYSGAISVYYGQSLASAKIYI